MNRIILITIIIVLITGCSDQSNSVNTIKCTEVGNSCSEDGKSIIQCTELNGQLSGKKIECESNQTCWQGSCIEGNCPPESCTAGIDACLDDTTQLLCKDRGDGCFMYEKSTCSIGETCSEGRCYKTDCSDICTAGEKSCVTDTRAQQCGNIDDDICTEWNLIICNEGDVCLDGNCIPKPECSISCGPYSSCVFEDGVAFCGCKQNHVDLNKDPVDGCECVYTNSKVEICDGIDNNCDGIIDNGGDALCTNRLAHATSICDSLDTNSCVITSCSTGWANRNEADIDGCEYLLGSCSTDCHNIHGSAYCAGETCILSCSEGWYDFDEQSINGCETGCYWNIRQYPLMGEQPIDIALTSSDRYLFTLGETHNHIERYNNEGYPIKSYSLTKKRPLGTLFQKKEELFLLYPYENKTHYLQPFKITGETVTPQESPLLLGKNQSNIQLNSDETHHLISWISQEQISFSWFKRTEYLLGTTISVTPKKEHVFSHKAALTGDMIAIAYCFQDNANEEKVGVRYLNYQGVELDDKTVVVAETGYCAQYGDAITLVATNDRFYLSFLLPELPGIVFQEHISTGSEIEIISKRQTDHIATGAHLYHQNGYLLWSGYSGNKISYHFIQESPFKTISYQSQIVGEEITKIRGLINDNFEINLMSKGNNRAFWSTTYPCQFNDIECHDLFCHGLVGYYPFENQLTEESGYSDTPQWSGGIPHFTTTPFGQGVELDQGKRLTGEGMLLPSTFTISFWINIIEFPLESIDLLTLSGDQYPLVLTLDPNALTLKGLTVFDEEIAPKTIPLELEQWYLITLRFNEEKLEILLNDTIHQILPLNTPAALLRSATKWTIGHSDESYLWHLVLDELRIYQRQLTLSEIKTILKEKR